MDSFDVVVIGAGPAGGQCARALAAAGAKVLLVEKSKDFDVNNFSTAGSLNEVMEDFGLPQTVVGASWREVYIASTNDQVNWRAEEEQGVVFDFAALRAFLADEVKRSGQEVLMGYSYHSHQEGGDHSLVDLKETGGDGHRQLAAKVIVDASGAQRAVLNPKLKKWRMVEATGIEHLLQVSDRDWELWRDKLAFFIGNHWMPQGYGWIFPMERGRLKVGVGRYFAKEKLIPHEESYRYYLDQIINQKLQDPSQVVDRHGKTLFYSIGRNDAHVHGRVIGIGDAISMINPLALEGIRHAMWSGSTAATHILRYLEKPDLFFYDYKRAIRSYTAFSWRACEYLMRQIYREKKDLRIDAVVRAFKHLSQKEMIDLCFHYKGKLAIRYALRLIKERLFN